MQLSICFMPVSSKECLVLVSSKTLPYLSVSSKEMPGLSVCPIQTQTGPVSTWERSSVLNALASIATWEHICPESDQLTWTSGREYTRYFFCLQKMPSCFVYQDHRRLSCGVNGQALGTNSPQVPWNFTFFQTLP